MASVSGRWAARDLPGAIRELESAQAEIDAGDWWDGPPPHMEMRRDEAADRVAEVIRRIMEADR